MSIKFVLYCIVKVSLIKLMATISKPIAAPERKRTAEIDNFFFRDLLKKIKNSQNFQRERNDEIFEIGRLLARLRPILVRYLQNCLAICAPGYQI